MAWVLFALATLFWIALIVTLILDLPRASSSEEQARAIGRLIGRFVFPFLGVLAGRLIYVRLRKPPRPRFWSPWILVITTALAILLVLPAAIRSAGVATQRVDAESYIQPIAEFQYAENAAAERQARDLFERDPALGDDLDIAVREVTADGQALGAIVILGLDPADAASDAFRSGVERGFTAEAGLEAEEVMLGSTEALYAESQGGAMLAWWHENLFIVLSAPDRETAEQVATELMAAND